MGVKTIGIIGGGQLGLMIAEQAARLGARTISLDPAPDAPAFRVCDEHIVAAYDDAAALEELCRRSDVVTYEFENVPGEVIVPLMERYNIPQGYKPLYDSQDRVREKSNARDNGLQTPRFAEVIDRESLLRGLFEIGYPCVFKTRTLGYDGHGQVVLRRPEDIAKTEPYWGTPAILEEFVPFDYEASIVMVSDGERIVSFPIGQNIHREGILDLCLVPAPKMSDEVRGRLVRQSEAFMCRCGYKGILAIEYFIRGEEIYFNEMAPRPHNSGHYTIEGCTTNQFRELCRFLLGLPLEEPKLVAPTVMKNILGEDLEAAEAIAREIGHGTDSSQSRQEPGVYVHIYGKTVSKPKRKMGHITYVGMTPEQYDAEWRSRFVE